MQFVKPIPFEEALDKIGRRTPIGSTFSSSEWADVPVELRELAFFSSRVESVRVLQRARDGITDFLKENREDLGNGVSALKVGSRSQFVDQMQEFLTREGVERSTGGLTDITSEKRLGLVFDTQTQQLQDYGYWKQGMDPDILDEFPAQRFIRIADVKEPRTSHTLYENQVFLKTDAVWAKEINKDFGVPWGPWGWGCWHDVEDEDRASAEQLGLLKPGEQVKPDTRNFAENMKASARGLDPDLLDKLKGEFGERLTVEGDMLKWNTATKPAAVDLLPAPARKSAGVERQSPVSGAFDLKVHGKLRDQVNIALDAIDKVHDDGELPKIPLTDTRERSYGYLKYRGLPGAYSADHIAVRSNSPWPSLTAAHETGHLLDLEAIGAKGEYATLSGFADMKRVLAAAEKTETIGLIRERLTMASRTTRAEAQYLLKPQEIWARLYAQFIAERSAAPALVRELALLREAAPLRGWGAEEFAPVAVEIEKMFKNLGWL